MLGTLAVAAVYWLATTLFDRRTGLVAALVAACYPGAIAMSVFVLSEAPFCPLYLGQIAAWIKSWQAFDTRRSLSWAAASGVLGGLATLMRPDWLLFVPFACSIGAFVTSIQPIQNPESKIQNLQRHAAIVSLMLLLVAAVMAPWWWRNARVVGHFVPTTLQVGASLYDGLNPQANGASEMSFVREFTNDEQRNPSLPGEPFEYRLDWRLRQASLRWAANHPGRMLKLAAIKFIRMWNIWPNDPQNRSGLLRFVTAVTYAPAIGLALAGIWISRRQFWPAGLCWLPAVYLTLLHLIFVSSIRYREPPMVGLLVFTAAFLTRGTRPSPAQ
jgi:4-amino-4-deoxy-L-arabinose transferase-like glycosyltransferase